MYVTNSLIIAKSSTTSVIIRLVPKSTEIAFDFYPKISIYIWIYLVSLFLVTKVGKFVFSNKSW